MPIVVDTNARLKIRAMRVFRLEGADHQFIPTLNFKDIKIIPFVRPVEVFFHYDRSDPLKRNPFDVIEYPTGFRGIGITLYGGVSDGFNLDFLTTMRKDAAKEDLFAQTVFYTLCEYEAPPA